jgi:hypothetical protein
MRRNNTPQLHPKCVCPSESTETETETETDTLAETIHSRNHFGQLAV